MTHVSSKRSVIYNLLPCLIYTWLISYSAIPVFCQVQELSGTITYETAQVLSIDTLTQTFELDRPELFFVGDKVLIIKMQGAEIDEAPDVSFGDVGNDNATGRFEISSVCSILDNKISFTHALKYNYAPNGAVDGKIQVIKIPTYEKIVINGPDPLTAPAWNGNTGGVLVLEALESITLFSDIDMSGRGFRGGIVDQSSVACLNTSVPVDSFYVNPVNGNGAWKGESVASYIPGKQAGKGHLANGGGGGNFPYTGGGGGSNGGVGGAGGSTTNSVCEGNDAGIGGQQLEYNVVDKRIFMGGGGGTGHNGSLPELSQAGGNGGGIIILITRELIGNDYSIRTNGDSPNLSADGGAGGGGGGTIVLAVDVFNTNVGLSANGGDGGFSSMEGPECQGPGGSVRRRCYSKQVSITHSGQLCGEPWIGRNYFLS